MLFRVLGSIEVDLGDGVVVAPQGSRARALLAALLLRPGSVVSVHSLASAMWGEEVPARRDNAVHVAVGRLRRALAVAGPRLVTSPPGYVLDLDGARLDAALFEELCRAARSSVGPAEAVRLYGEALELWRGPAFAEFATSFATAAAVRLEKLRRAALEDRTEALLRSGALDEAVAAAGDLIAEDRLAARPVAVSLQALASLGRTPEALDTYGRYAAALREELGLEPPPELKDLHTQVLRGQVSAPARQPRAVLPYRPSALVGREEELRALAGASRHGTLLTVTGPGGVGKTRIALELAHQWAADGRDVWWVDLVSVDAARVLDAVATATGVELAAGADPAGALCTALAPVRGLLILDNAEHVLDGVAVLVERLLDTAPGLAILVTSRERLALDQECLQSLPPLPLPVGGDLSNPAVRLFLERAPTLRTLDQDGLVLVAELCRRLDGLPLAIELGAARATALGLETLADRLALRLDLLGGGRRTADRRHRTLRAVVEWSHELLSADEAVLFRRLGVFPGTFTLDQVEAVCGGELPAANLAALLARLVEQSLVQRGERGRFQLLETLRAFAVERLEASGERSSLRARHAHDTLARLVDGSCRLLTKAEAEAVGELTDLTPDLHAAWSYAAANERVLALRLAAEIYDFAYFRQRLGLLSWGLEAATWTIDKPELAAALGTAAAAMWSAARISDAATTAERGISLAGGQDRPAAALPMKLAADVAMILGRTDEAVTRYRQHAALRIARGEPLHALGSELAVAHTLSTARRYTEAATVVTELLPQAVRSGNPTVLAWAHYLAGEVAFETDPERAAAEYRKAIAYGSTADSRLFVTMARTSAAALAARVGNTGEALEGFSAVLDEWLRLGNTGAVDWTLQHVVVLLADLGRDHDAAVLAGALTSGRDTRSALPVDAERLRVAMQGVRSRLGINKTDAALDDGAALPSAEALAHTRQALATAAEVAKL